MNNYHQQKVVLIFDSRCHSVVINGAARRR
jgi:hypothetical protein